MSTDLTRTTLGGPVMGTRWSALLDCPAITGIPALTAALTAAVTEVDAQMSTWKPDTPLMQLNRAPLGQWVEIPREMMEVLTCGLKIGRESDGAFDIGLGDLVTAWGYCATDPDKAAIRANLGTQRRPAHEVLDLDEPGLRVRKRSPISLDLSGIAKGFAVDRMFEVCTQYNITSALLGLDGELRSIGRQADGKPWSVAIEKPDYENRLPHSILDLQDAAAATSGDYRHWIAVGQTRFSHTMDARRGGPVQPGIASTTVVAADCMTADAAATAVMVLGLEKGSAFLRKMGLDGLILARKGPEIIPFGVGPLFGSDEELRLSAS